jgi:AraC-like DNA-binding protein
MKQAMPLTEARAFIEAHFDEPVTLAQLAELSALSVSRFATAFRQQFGSSPYRYLCGLRIERAQALLLAGVPGSVVAAEVGFFDQSHFARHFKRFCGMTPSMYLKRSRARCSLPASAGLLRGAGNGIESADQRTLACLVSESA